jgi:hypothetical protein
MRVRVGVDGRAHLVERRGGAELHGLGVGAQADVVVRVDEARQHQAAGRVHLPRVP